MCVCLHLCFDCVENWMLSTYILIDLTFEKRFLAVSWMALSIYIYFSQLLPPIALLYAVTHRIEIQFQSERKMYAVNMKIYLFFLFII